MKKHGKLFNIWILFITFLKIGLFTFGGGYAMIPLIQKEMVEKHKWMKSSEMMDIIAIADSTPGPVSVNCSTFIGYRIGGILGSILSTIGVILPSFIIIFIISLFFDQFVSITVIANALLGIKCAVVILILSAVIKLASQIKMNWLSISIIIAIIIISVILAFFSYSFSSIYYILIGGGCGVIFALIKTFKEKRGISK